MELKTLTLNGKTYDSFSSDVLIVTADVNVASHSAIEINAATEAGKIVFLSFDGSPIPLSACSADRAVFVKPTNNTAAGSFGEVSASVDNEKKLTYDIESFEVYAKNQTDEKIASAVEDALTQAKVNGDFKGDPGKDGKDGQDGYTPQKGKDYFTDAEKQEIAERAADLVDVSECGTNDYNELENKPVIPSSVNAVEHQYAVSNSKDRISNVETWNTIANPLTQRQRACIYGNGYYVVCGTSGEMVYSLDGTAWISVTKFTDGVITGIAFGKGIFAAIDSNGVIWIAEEAPFEWEAINIAWEQLEAGATQILEGICYANNRFVLVGDFGLVAFSDNGKIWVETRTAYDFKAVAFGNGRYVGAGNSGKVAISYDGETWAEYSDPSITGSYRAAAFGRGRYVIGCQGGIIRYSDDGRTWTTATTDSTSSVNYIRGIVYTEGKFYAVMYVSTGKGEIWVSDDAETWTVQQVTPGRLWCCACADGVVIASGDVGAIYLLDLGIEWQPKQPELAGGQYLWERIVFTLSDGGTVVSDGVCIGGSSYSKSEIDSIMGSYINDIDALIGGDS